ncbi:MAG: D-2-hydroxyacid dehydrogenase [Pseudomonadota bacterium]
MPNSVLGERSLERVLVTVRYRESKRQEIKSAYQGAEIIEVANQDRAQIYKTLQTVDAALIQGVMDPNFLESDRLKWVHCDQSGLDAYAVPEIFERGLIVTSSSGRSAHPLAEHALFFMLSFTHDAPAFAKAQRRRVWGVVGQNDLRALYGRHVAIVGYGKTGQCLAAKCRSFGMKITAYRRKDLPSRVQDVRVFSRDAGHAVRDAMDGADFVVMTASLNDASYHLVDREALGSLRRGAYLVNIGRALTVDQDAMIAALRSGQLSGAGLDVTATEPLPMKSPLWGMKKVIITPHVTPQMPDRAQETLSIVARNAERFQKTEPLKNALTPEDVFTGQRPSNASRLERAFERRWRRYFGVTR